MSTAQLVLDRMQRIRAQLQRDLQPQSIELFDDSHAHVGHAHEGKGHFRVRLVSARFEGLRPLQRHQLVFRSLAQLLQTDIHAVTISALTPQEAARATGAA